MNDAIKWTFGQIVHSVLSERNGIITGITLRPGDHRYLVTWQDTADEAYCFEFELSEEKTFQV